MLCSSCLCSFLAISNDRTTPWNGGRREGAPACSDTTAGRCHKYVLSTKSAAICIVRVTAAHSSCDWTPCILVSPVLGGTLQLHVSLHTMTSHSSKTANQRSDLQKRKTYWEARKVQTVTASPLSTQQPPCQYASECGGCSLQSFSYQDQISSKQDRLRFELQQIAKVADVDSVLRPIIPAPEPFRWGSGS